MKYYKNFPLKFDLNQWSLPCCPRRRPFPHFHRSSVSRNYRPTKCYTNYGLYAIETVTGLTTNSETRFIVILKVFQLAMTVVMAHWTWLVRQFDGSDDFMLHFGHEFAKPSFQFVLPAFSPLIGVTTARHYSFHHHHHL